ncbi:hypothetical protein IT397_02810 [Candidatus Nomurabacteria bacterium]|nr:hypothetical protein [Candidatus Nomurabacteria bacterium]
MINGKTLKLEFSTINSQLLTSSQSGYPPRRTSFYFGARYYDSGIGRWLSVDPLMDKYPGWSPYNYVMGNPLRLVDPDGREIRIYTDEKDKQGNSLYITYTAGMQYDGDNQFVAAVISALNNMNSVNIGSELISSLISSTNTFDFMNKISASEGTLQFVPNINGGGEILASAITDNSTLANLGSVAHELFHGYQYENVGLFGANSEVEAYLYSYSITGNFNGISMMFSGNSTSAGQAYESAMNKLFIGDFNRKTFNQAAQNFAQGNPFGLYSNTRYYSNFTPLINRFYPLLSY